MSFTLTRPAFDAIAEATTGDDVSLRTNYVGRGMYSADTCLALVCASVTDLVCWTFDLMEQVDVQLDEIAEEIAGLIDAMRDYQTRADNMGHGSVYYWPEISVAPLLISNGIMTPTLSELEELLEPNGNV